MKENGKLNILKVIMFLSLILVLVFNVFADILPISGVTTEQVSLSYPNGFVPVHMTFYIWYLIYALLVLFMLYFLGVFRGADKVLLRRLSVPFIISNIFDAAWIVAWNSYHILLSVVFMVGVLVSLAVVYDRAGRYELSVKQKWLVRLPLSVYFGWMTIAGIGNIIALCVSLGIGGFSNSIWLVIVMGAAALLGAMISINNRDAAFGLVFVWAYAGILLKHIEGFNGTGIRISVTAAAALAFLVTATIIAAVYKKRHAR